MYTAVTAPPCALVRAYSPHAARTSRLASSSLASSSPVRVRSASVGRHARVGASGQEGGLSYKAAGVDIEAGNELVRRIQKLNPSIGGFSGMVPFGDSYLVAGTDGVGTKLKLAFDLNTHDTVGIDLVAMSVNDIITSGARPMFFLDYFACGKLDVDTAEQVRCCCCCCCCWSGCRGRC